MSLIGKTMEEQIWNFLVARIGNAYGTAALMGNLSAESGLNPGNLENRCERLLKEAGKPYCTDGTYTAAVDSGQISRAEFLNPLPSKQYGYGLAQWTSPGRKAGLYDYVRSKGVSIGNLEAQLEFLFMELVGSYKAVLNALKNAASVREASDIVLEKYEIPADRSESVKVKRAGYGQAYYNKYAGAVLRNGGSKGGNSPLVNCTVPSPNRYIPRNRRIDAITPHCVVGQLSAEAIGGLFTSTSRNASCNYAIGSDGRIVLVVDEDDGSWCSSSEANDRRAVTIECASDKAAPYAMNDAVYGALVRLCADICRRHGISRLLWLGSKEKTLAYTLKSGEAVLTAHRWFENKSCPGDWLYSRYGDLADRVNALLCTAGSAQGNTRPPVPAASSPMKPAGKSVEELAGEVIQGRWGNGADRRNRLSAAGYDYAAVQAAVNRILK